MDTLRFIAALWVTFGHCGYFPLTQGIDRTSSLGSVVSGIYANLFAAVPAVIVFFVISGFCIHYPHRSQSDFRLLPYLVRRYLRIGIPLLGAIFLARLLGLNLPLFHNTILWSLFAELIFYSLYPFLRRLIPRYGWNRILTISFLLAYAAVLTHPTALDYSPFGVMLDWLITMPCWLLGCRLAEHNIAGVTDPLMANPWKWRLLIWFLSWGCSVLRFHSPIGYPWTLDIFALAVFFWLKVEITFYRSQPAPHLLEWAGRWSYSIYLIHMIANATFDRIPTPNLGANLNWIVRIAFILSFAYAFYLIAERPGHLIAQWFSRRLRKEVFNNAHVEPEIAVSSEPLADLATVARRNM